MHIKGNKKIINGWAMYDWSNSVYSLVITSTVFPIYFNTVTPEQVTFMGLEWINTSLYSLAISFSFLVIACFSPMLSAIADYSGKKKGFMKTFCYLGAISCMVLYFFDGQNLALGIWAFILASIGYSGSIVFYNAYLPEIAEPADQDRVSAKGFAMGYIGSVILLLFNLSMILFPGTYGLTETSAFPAKFSFFLVGIWWVGFAQITFSRMPKNIYNRKPEGNYLFKGYQELKKVWRQFKEIPFIRIYLAGFFFYTMGVQTVMYLAATFGEKELSLPADILITTVLVIQLVAIPGAVGFSRLSGKLGNIPALMICIVICIVICIGAYFITGATGFIITGGFVGLVMGGVQSLSRSTYSKMLPETKDHASYFSFYDVCEKVAIVLGTASFGIIELITGDMRNTLIALTVFFVIGFVFLGHTRRRLPKKLRESGASL